MPEEQQAPFMIGCLSPTSAMPKNEAEQYEQYCRCGMQVAGEVVPAAEWSTGIAQGTRSKLAARTIQECRKHLADASIEAAFMHGCVGSDAKKTKYCACSAKGIKGKVGIEGLMGSAPSAEAILAIASCTKLMPESMIHNGFVTSCSKRAEVASCECLWSELRKTNPPAALAVDEAGMTPRLREAMNKSVAVCKKKAATDPGAGF
jgi:hypothetical protein